VCTAKVQQKGVRQTTDIEDIAEEEENAEVRTFWAKGTNLLGERFEPSGRNG